jgi:holo-[acyl-carrier protein] synthase
MAIYGVGVDIVEIDRIKGAVERWKRRFIKRLFTQEEINYCTEKKDPYRCFAARFAAKEAVLKALGTGWGDGIGWLDIEILNTRSGKPWVKFRDRAEEFMKLRSLKKVFISLSHSRDYAAAVAVIEQ